MRTKGSCRFEAYFKAQFYDPMPGAWRDIQKAFPTEEGARGIFGRMDLVQRQFRTIFEGRRARERVAATRRWRIMRIAPERREPLPEVLL